MKKTDTSIGDQLTFAQTAIDNGSTNADIVPLLTQRGYGVQTMNQARALYEEAVAKVNARQAREGEQLSQSADFKNCWKACRTIFQEIAKSARALWGGNRDLLKRIALDKPMPRRVGDFKEAAGKLFSSANYTAEMLAQITAKGIDSAKFSQGNARLTDLTNADQRHENAKGDTRQATEEQKTALRTLKKWMGTYIKFARLALAAKPQLLRKLGVRPGTSPTKRQIEGRRKAAETRQQKKAGLKLKAA
jgi:hypothetical protein